MIITLRIRQNHKKEEDSVSKKDADMIADYSTSEHNEEDSMKKYFNHNYQ